MHIHTHRNTYKSTKNRYGHVYVNHVGTILCSHLLIPSQSHSVALSPLTIVPSLTHRVILPTQPETRLPINSLCIASESQLLHPEA